jgi:hypothetical protein
MGAPLSLRKNNLPPYLINNIFNLFTTNSIIGGDFNGHHLAWDSSHHDHGGDIIHTAISNHNLSLINTGSPTCLNRAPYPDTAEYIAFSSPNLNFFFKLVYIG